MRNCGGGGRAGRSSGRPLPINKCPIIISPKISRALNCPTSDPLSGTSVHYDRPGTTPWRHNIKSPKWISYYIYTNIFIVHLIAKLTKEKCIRWERPIDCDSISYSQLIAGQTSEYWLRLRLFVMYTTACCILWLFAAGGWLVGGG